MALILPIVLFLALGVTACDGRQPTAPSPYPPLRTFQISGTVADTGGVTVEGATVRMSGPAGGSTLTDAHGAYSLTTEAPDRSWTSATIQAEKPGYESNLQYVKGANPSSQNFLLHWIVRIAAGESVRVAVGPHDTFCGLADQWRCRTVRVMSSVSGILSVEVLPENSGKAAALEINGPPQHYSCCASQAVIEMPAGAEAVVNILRSWSDPDAADMFTLNTSLSPR